ncbi:DEAD/DEAH box helicase [Pseudomonas matsuisoli]|uniref:ATP-dependent RNA helicase RhlE n=1 Tax=Pseudomonas matsuisoli TaxID=1515666 RepID=A0A917V0G4_9PSED|nr:DEAD/DEAH box helicase [Pseudomonas matsuisoli]GGK04799.1 ATP-dependent RNA helicase RhlE [Pseudomonas matsuisoli]
MSFASLGLSEALVRAVEAAGYTEPTPVQQRAVPAVLQGRDLMVAAQTGTGKTGGFALPVLELLFPGGQADPACSRTEKQPRVLVLTPTRELAAQVHDSFKLYARDLALHSACIFGGVGMNPQIKALAKGLDVLVACPGRLLDLVGQKAVDLSAVEILVLDEADRMLDMGFIHDVKKVLAKLPTKRQNLLFSATFSKDITDLATKLLHDPERIEVTPPNTTVERIEQRIFRLAANQKRALLAHLVTMGAWEQVLVFTRTKHGANRLAEYLNKQNLPAAAIHGNKSQNARTKALADFKANSIRILVATDIAARGLDIDQLPHVVNFELPNVEEDYVHRIGRTGRAGRSGEAISLVAPDEEKLLKAIERLTKQRIPDGDMQGFDPSTLEVEKPEVRAPREAREPRQPRQPRGERKRPAAAKDSEATTSAASGSAEQGENRPERTKRRRNRRRGKGPEGTGESTVAKSQPATVAAPADRDPEEFLDDDFDNFGNRADYVSPNQNNNRRGRNGGQKPARNQQGGRPAGRGDTANQANANNRGGGKPKGRNGAPRNNGAGANGQRGQRRADTHNRDNFSRGEPQPQERQQRQPLIVRKGERLPSLEQLESLSDERKRTEKPALLTRNR